jgi:hypothetical protein
MTFSSIFTIFSLVALLALAALVVFIFKKGGGSRLSPLTALAFASILAGIFLGSQGWIGDALLGIGVVLAFADIVRRSKNR